MKQIVQWPDSGVVELIDVAQPRATEGRVLVRNAYSAISVGTERSMVQFGSGSLLAKARARPDLVKRVIQKARTEGLVSTIEATQRRLKDPTLLGYSCAGVVLEVGPGVSGVAVGDRVACGGAGYACHAEVVSVPRNLVAAVPDGVGLDRAAFTIISSIPMHAFRLAEVGLSDCVVIMGLGLMGQLASQMAVSAGCRVIAYDPDAARCQVAAAVEGVQAVSDAAMLGSLVSARTGGIGADAVIITASTSSSEPIAMAADVSRDRGRVVMLGATGMDVPRRPFFEKELTFLVSRSYGPGRYDPLYEEGGADYPPGFVKWTEGRNMEAVLDLMARRGVDLGGFEPSVLSPERAVELYAEPDELAADLAVLIRYADGGETGVGSSKRTVERGGAAPGTGDALTLGVVGAGQFARSILLPAIEKAGGFRFRTVTSAGGVSAAAAGRQFGFEREVPSFDDVLADDEVGTVVILTRHNLHADQIVRAFAAGKNVFVEKPLALNEAELRAVERAVAESNGSLFVGYNRRYAPLVQEVERFVSGTSEPGVFTYRVNGGFIPADHWTQSPELGGGRIVGEACHFVDLLMCLSGETPVAVSAAQAADRGKYSGDNVVASIEFDGGSIGSICYTASGDRAGGKERLEVFRGGRFAEVDDFRVARLVSGGKVKVHKSRLRQDKGHVRQWHAIREALLHGRETIPSEELIAGALCTFKILDSIRQRSRVPVGSGETELGRSNSQEGSEDATEME